MAFVLKGEIEIDGSKATTGLRGVQKEATKTANTFKQSDASAQKLGKTLVSLGLNASKAGTSLGMLARLGTGGIFGYAVIGAMNKFGETVKQASTDYYSAQKDLADAFETSFKSTSVEQAQAGLEKTQDTIERLRGETTQLGPLFSRLGKNIESLSGISLGIGSREKSLEQANQELILQEDILKLRQSEKKDKEARDRAESQIKFDKMVFNGEQKLADQAEAREKQTEQERVQRKIDNNNRIYREERYNLDEKIKMESDADDRKFQRLVRDANRAREQQKRTSETASGTAGGVLGASVAGRQALDVARKQREQQLKTENFKVAERIAPTQRDREKLAAQQVAGEMPSLGEQIRGGLTGVDPSQLAREAAASKFERDRMVGVPGRGMVGGTSSDAKLGQEQSTLSKETLQAIKKLVELMQSGTVVK
jgi:hypothetical protein